MSPIPTRTALFASFIVVLASTASVACDGDSPSGPANRNPFPEAGAANGDGATVDCFENPTTHEEIINACTNAVRITKNPTLPKLRPDGTLPPLE